MGVSNRKLVMGKMLFLARFVGLKSPSGTKIEAPPLVYANAVLEGMIKKYLKGRNPPDSFACSAVTFSYPCGLISHIVSLLFLSDIGIISVKSGVGSRFLTGGVALRFLAPTESRLASSYLEDRSRSLSLPALSRSYSLSMSIWRGNLSGSRSRYRSVLATLS